MRTFAKAGLVGMLISACLAGTGCGLDLMEGVDTDDEARLLKRVEPLTLQGAEGLQLCRWMELQLRRTEARIYPVKNYDDLVAVSVDGNVVCVDEAPIVIRAGVIPVDGGEDEGCGLSICSDGTPLPADKLQELARKYADQRTEF